VLEVGTKSELFARSPSKWGLAGTGCDSGGGKSELLFDGRVGDGVHALDKLGGIQRLFGELGKFMCAMIRLKELVMVITPRMYLGLLLLARMASTCDKEQGRWFRCWKCWAAAEPQN